jgi:voltage-gated potassium channel
MVQDREIQVESLEGEIRPYELFMLMLCMFSLMILVAETFFHLRPDEAAILDAADNLACMFFLIDFILGFAIAANKLQFLKWGWIDLISSIPVIDFVRAGRIVRVVRILRVLRGVRVARVMGRYLLRNRADGTILAAIFTSLMLLVLSSVAILQVEKDAAGRNIESPSDALWWAITTMTTVGYGDKFPVTTLGRIIAGSLMVSGVGLFGTLSGFVTSWILNPVEERHDVDLSAIQAELNVIETRLDQLSSAELKPPPDPELAEFIRKWPKLSTGTRDAIKRLINSN